MPKGGRKRDRSRRTTADPADRWTPGLTWSTIIFLATLIATVLVLLLGSKDASGNLTGTSSRVVEGFSHLLSVSASVGLTLYKTR